MGVPDTLSKEPVDAIELALDGIVGDRHRGIARAYWDDEEHGDNNERRNERQWSGVSREELAQIGEAMDLAEPLTAASLGANLCFEGVPELSRLSRGTLLKLSSGVELMVEEYNPPCFEMGEKIAETYTTRSGEPLSVNAFSQAAKFLRGIVGVVQVAGSIRVGDEVTVVPERLPKWLR
jgi:MOSC domain-containing protein YiiM